MTPCYSYVLRYPYARDHATRRCRLEPVPASCAVCGATARRIAESVAKAAPWRRRDTAWRVALTVARGDLETVWLVPSATGFGEARFCVRCAPTGELWAPECARCGDGPIVVLGPVRALPGTPAADRGAAARFLQEQGWSLDGPVMCGPCRTRPQLTSDMPAPGIRPAGSVAARMPGVLADGQLFQS